MRGKIARFVILARNFTFGRRKTGRVLIVDNGKLLVIHRKRYSKKLGRWLEYYSIPGGGTERGEAPERAAKRELKEELGVDVSVGKLLVHRIGKNFEHYVFAAEIIQGEPVMQPDSEEMWFVSERNQFSVEWVDVAKLNKENLRYYADCLEAAQQLAAGKEPELLVVDDRKNDII